MAVVMCKICDQIVDLDYNVEHGDEMHSEDCPLCGGLGDASGITCPRCDGNGYLVPEWI